MCRKYCSKKTVLYSLYIKSQVICLIILASNSKERNIRINKVIYAINSFTFFFFSELFVWCVSCCLFETCLLTFCRFYYWIAHSFRFLFTVERRRYWADTKLYRTSEVVHRKAVVLLDQRKIIIYKDHDITQVLQTHPLNQLSKGVS